MISHCFRWCVACILFWFAAPILAGEPEKPKLLVLVVFDQMRGDYLTLAGALRQRWFSALGTRGRLVHELPLSLCHHGHRTRTLFDTDGCYSCETWDRQ